MPDYEFHFPWHIANEYINNSPNIFDAPPIYGVDEYVWPSASRAFIEIYYRVRRKLAGLRIPNDVSIYYFEGENEARQKKEYDVSCSLRKAYQIDRIVSMHAVLSYHHPIAERLRGLVKDVNEFKSLRIIDKLFATLSKFSVPFELVHGSVPDADTRQFKILVHHSVKAISVVSNYYSPLSFSAQFVYALARFIADNAFVNEHLCAELKSMCEEYEKKCAEELDRVRVELDKFLFEDKLLQAVEYALQFFIPSKPLSIPVTINEVMERFNKEHDCDIHPDTVSKKIIELHALGKVYFDESANRWRLKL